MKIRTITVLKTDGTDETIECKGAPKLAVLQKAVGGYIEYVHLPRGNGQTKMVVNEEGRLDGLPMNSRASEIAQQSIVGNVAVY